MYRKEKNTESVCDSSALGVKQMESILPAPNIARKLGPSFKRKTKRRYLIRSGFVLVSLVFSFMIFSPSSPLYSNDHDNHRLQGEPKSSISFAGKLNRRLLQDETGAEATTEGTIENKESTKAANAR